MGETNHCYEIGVFKEALIDDNISVQVDAIKRLPALAASLSPERTRDDLLPCISNSIDAMAEESWYNLAEQLERVLPYIGGNEHAGILLNLLIKLASEDEILIRNRATDAMKCICEQLTPKQCEETFYPLIENLIEKDWFTTKCSAGCLITICYSKVSAEKQKELINHFRNLIQDDSPIVRRATATSLVDLISFLDVEDAKLEFVPVFDNLALDEQDSVRTVAVDVGVALSTRLKDFEIYEFLLITFKLLAEDPSWRVRLRLASRLHEVRISERLRGEIVGIYTKCVRDDEAEVRVYAAKNVYNLAVNLASSFDKTAENYHDVFEKYMEENIIPEIHLMLRDPSDDVRVALSTNILSISTIFRLECFNNNILPLVIDALENEEYMPFKENVLKNLNWLPADVDITKSVTSIQHVIRNLLENSQMHWRTRRNLLLAFMHMTRNSTREFFDENLKFSYQLLLNDPIYAIRRVAPVILPVLIKQFGCEWAKSSLIPIFDPFASDPKYLFRYITLFAIEELISPTLNKMRSLQDGKYLRDFKNYSTKKAAETLFRIVKLNEKLQQQINEEETEEVDYSSSDLKFYGEDTLDSLKKEYQIDIFSIGDLDECYLEGILLLLVKDFVEVVKTLIDDPVKNVQDRAKITLKLLKTFALEIKNEAEEEWVRKVLEMLDENDLKRIEEEMEKQLEKVKEMEEIDCDLVFVDNVEDVNNN